jgi:ornithine cyclodeaminase/alanine dehydrogenase-like protein (mu-crystallin family)
VAGRAPGRTDPSERFVFDSTGTALQDVAAAAIVYERAVASGRGQRLALAPA